jgi:transposase
LWRRSGGYGASIWARGKSIKEIARTLHLSRNTVRRILRSGETAFVVQPRPKLGPWADELDRLLSANAKAATRGG